MLCDWCFSFQGSSLLDCLEMMVKSVVVLLVAWGSVQCVLNSILDMIPGYEISTSLKLEFVVSWHSICPWGKRQLFGRAQSCRAGGWYVCKGWIELLLLYWVELVLCLWPKCAVLHCFVLRNCSGYKLEPVHLYRAIQCCLIPGARAHEDSTGAHYGFLPIRQTGTEHPGCSWNAFGDLWHDLVWKCIIKAWWQRKTCLFSH